MNTAADVTSRRGRPALHWLDAALRFVELILTIAAGTAILAAMLLVTGSALARYAFQAPLSGVGEIVSIFLMPLFAYFGLAVTLREKHHVGVTLVIGRLSGRLRRYTQCIAALITTVMFVLIGYAGLLRTQSTLEAALVSDLRGIPLGLAYIVVPIGCFAIAARAVFLCSSWLLNGADRPTLAQDPHSSEENL